MSTSCGGSDCFSVWFSLTRRQTYLSNKFLYLRSTRVVRADACKKISYRGHCHFVLLKCLELLDCRCTVSLESAYTYLFFLGYSVALHEACQLQCRSYRAGKGWKIRVLQELAFVFVISCPSLLLASLHGRRFA